MVELGVEATGHLYIILDCLKEFIQTTRYPGSVILKEAIETDYTNAKREYIILVRGYHERPECVS